jgi:predicted phage terminase large subunit-like protein
MVPETESLARLLSLQPETDRKAILKRLSKQEAERLEYDWQFWGRPKQQPPPGDWHAWLILAGRGWGKTRTGGEWVRGVAKSGQCGRIAIVGSTAADARDVMIEGESGLLAISPPWFRPEYEPSKRRLTWPNGAIATAYSADEPDRLRGPQHDGAWADEIASWKYPETWDMLLFGLRLGRKPRVVATTTPKPVELVRRLIEDADTAVTRGSTYENADNLAPTFIGQIVRRYEGTRLGRQELHAEVLEDVEGAFWHLAWIDSARVKEAPILQHIVVAIDPAATHGEDADETGIVVAGKGEDGEFYVVHGAGYRLSPHGWAKRALDLYDQFKGDRIIAERNNGGEMVEETLRSVRGLAPVKTIVASRGKTVRAEPVAALYEQGKVHHVGTFPTLEDQMCRFPVATEHDDQVDALVYALSELTDVHPFVVQPLGKSLIPPVTGWEAQRLGYR